MSSESSPLLDARIKLNSNEVQLVQDLLEQWRLRQILNPPICAKLLGTIELQDRFDWHRLAKYIFRLSLVCLIIAVVTLLFDTAFLRLIYKVLEINAYARSAVTMAISLGIHYHAYRRSRKLPTEVWMNEAIHAVGAIVVGLAALQLAEGLNGLRFHNGGIMDIRGRQVLWLLACVYAVIGIATTSNFIWSCSMLIMGIFTAYWVPHRGAVDIFFGDYPVRFIILGGALIFVACCMCMQPRTLTLCSSTRIWGLTYFFLFGLWYGNILNSLTIGRRSPFWEGILWALALTAAAVLSTWHGLKYDDTTTKLFGLTFLALDIYTRYWDFFWGSMYRPLFFTVLAGSFAMVGWGAEQMWRTRAEKDLVDVVGIDEHAFV